MNTDEIIDILKKVQVNSCNHQRCLKHLELIFNKMDQNEFLQLIFGYLRGTVFNLHNEYSERIIDFFAKFVVRIAAKREAENPDDPDISFIESVIDLTLETHASVQEFIRYNSFFLLKLILQNIGEECSLDSDLFDKIQDASLSRAYDTKHSVQLQALQTLHRLQNPTNPNCPIIKTFSALVATDKNAAIRAEIVKMIAGTPSVLPLIKSRTRDSNNTVQKVAFNRCAGVSPKNFTIEDRQFILKSGLACDGSVKKVFINLLLTWFNFYERDFVKFFHALNFGAIMEDDFKDWVTLCKELFKHLVKNIPLEEIINGLPLHDRLIPLDETSEPVETILFWLLTIRFLKESDLLNDWDAVLPDLAPFCDYIESISQLKNKYIREGKWDTLKYSQILYQLLEILEFCDISEEVGRQKLRVLILKLIKEEAGNMRNLKKLIPLLSKLIPQKEDLTDAVRGIISELHEVYVGSDVAPTPVDNIDAKIIQTQIWTAQIQLDDAIAEGDYLQAEQFKNKLNEAREKLNQLHVAVETPVMNEAERNTIACNCLNVFSSLIELPLIDTLTGTIQSIFDLVILPLSGNDNEEVRCRFLRAVGYICLLEKSMGEMYNEFLMSPLVNYYNGNFQKETLISTLELISDLFLYYNTKLFPINANLGQSVTKRKLYSNNDDIIEDIGITKTYKLETLIPVIMDIVDDADITISKAALLSIHRMIMNNLSIGPDVFSRLLLKWYNPQADSSIRQLLSFMIDSYLNHVKTGREVMIQSIGSVLRQINSAGMENPLAEIEVDRLLSFFALFTRSDDQTNNYHLSISEMVLDEIRKEPGPGLYVQHLTKLLVFLKIPKENVSVIRRMINQVDSLMEDVALTKREAANLIKFKAAIMADIVLNDEADDTQNINGNQTPAENDSLHVNLNSLPPGCINNTNQSDQLAQGKSADTGVQHTPNRDLRVVLIQQQCLTPSHNFTLDNNSTRNKSSVSFCRKAKSSSRTSKQTRLIRLASSSEVTIDSDSDDHNKKTTRQSIKNQTVNHKKTINQIGTSSSEVISESDSDCESRRLIRNSFINRSVSGSSMKNNQTTRSRTNNDKNKSTSTTPSTQSTLSPANNRKRRFDKVPRILLSDVRDGEKGAVHQLTPSLSSDKSSQSNKRKKTRESPVASSSNEIISASDSDQENQTLMHQSFQSLSSGKRGQNQVKRMSTRQSSQSSSLSHNSSIIQRKNPKKNNGRTVQTSSSSNGHVSDSDSQNKKTTSQSIQSSSGSGRSTRNQRGSHKKNDGQTTQTSSSTNGHASDLESQNKKMTSESIQSSSPSARSTRSQRKKSSNEIISASDSDQENQTLMHQSYQSLSRGKRGQNQVKRISTRQSSQSSSLSHNSSIIQRKNHKKNNDRTVQTSSSSNGHVSDSDSQNKKTTSQSIQSSSGSGRSTRNQRGSHEKNDGQTTQTSSSTNGHASDLGSQNKKTTSESIPSSSGSGTSTRSRRGNLEKNNGETTQTSSSTNGHASDLESQNKKTTSESIQSSSPSARSTRSQRKNHEKINGETTQTSSSTNGHGSEDSQNKKTTSQSIQSSSGSGISTRSQRGNREKNNGQTTQSSSSTNGYVSALSSQNKTTSESIPSSSGSVMSTRSQRGNRKKNNGQLTQTSSSTNGHVSDLDSQNKTTTSESIPSSLESSISTRSQMGNRKNNKESLFPRESSLDSSIENHPTNKIARSPRSSSSSVENNGRNARKVPKLRHVSSSDSSVRNNDENVNKKKLRELSHTSSSSRTTRRQNKRKIIEAPREKSSSSLSSSPSRKRRKTATLSFQKGRLR